MLAGPLRCAGSRCQRFHVLVDLALCFLPGNGKIVVGLEIHPELAVVPKYLANLRGISEEMPTLEDFPQFIVSAVRRRKTSATGFTRFELHGRFDRIIADIDPHWFWLLFGANGSLCANLKSLDQESRAAILTCDV